MKIMRPMKTMRRFALLGLTCLILTASRLSVYYASFLKSDTAPPRPSDAIVLLSHGQNGPDWLSLIGAQRTLGALKLYHENFAPVIISSGSNPERHWDQAGLQADWLERAGVPRKALIVERRSHRTYESAVEIDRLMRERGWHNIAVVVSEFDRPRVRLLFQRLGIQASFLEVPESGPPRELFSTGYWGVFYHASYEYLGLFYYWYRGWI
jgi:uncharacterized SAM-binding protein YcdF (DUF218 family)